MIYTYFEVGAVGRNVEQADATRQERCWVLWSLLYGLMTKRGQEHACLDVSDSIVSLSLAPEPTNGSCFFNSGFLLKTVTTCMYMKGFLLKV
jgi:hypothetical protein